jgi:hypothetical protein
VTYNRDKYKDFKESITTGDEEAVAVFATFAEVRTTSGGGGGGHCILR